MIKADDNVLVRPEIQSCAQDAKGHEGNCSVAEVHEPDEDDGTTDADWDEQASLLLTATAFAAIYLARGRQPVGIWWHAEVSFMSAVEVLCQIPAQQRRATMYVPPAATWILLAGEGILDFCRTDFDRADGAKGATSYGHEWPWGKGRGFSMARWALWKTRFGEIATTQGLKDDVKDIAARAAAEMARIAGLMR
ncbi:MAG: hypothetical protein M1816_003614 [Peltula sp. TS41687]|nr:MAG: hypothetical protein M1816_003614 [Peltula sp. TS41687]